MKKILFLLLVLPILSGCVIKDNLSVISALAKEAVVTFNAEDDYFYVTKVVDGDTIDVNINGMIERVRLIGIDSPESVAPGRAIECFGLESSKGAEKILKNQLVRLEADSTQDNRDKYGRLLRYVTTKSGTAYGLEAIKQGLAFEYTFKNAYKYQKQFKAAQLEAQNNKSGLWSDLACGKKYETKKISALCLIKGDISVKKIKSYYLPTCSNYGKIVVNSRLGEKLFCTEKEAQKAGFKKALDCK